MVSEPILRLTKKDFTVTTSRSSGKGGQNVNKRDTKVRVRHQASGAVGVSETHRTQAANKKEAFRRMTETKEFKNWLKVELARRGVEEQETLGGQGPTGGRGEKIRTYNYPRGTVKDHRTGAVGKLEGILDGDMDEFLGEVRLGMLDES